MRVPRSPGQDERAAQTAAPFLRWAGSKRWLTSKVHSMIPDEFGTYFEPFLGSGAMFFSLGLPGERCRLSDSVPALINCFEQVRDAHIEIHAVVDGWDCDRDAYYQVRSLEPADNLTRAAQFIYLNRLCFNGLYRVNRSGRFNVPYGRPRFQRVFSAPEELATPAFRLRGAHLSVLDFAEATKDAVGGDLVYLDPPYVAGHRNNGFVDYNARVFRWEDQRRLAEHCDELSDRGVMIIQSNADHPSIRDLYGPSYQTQSVSRFSSMSAAAGARGISEELLITNAPLAKSLA